jgi:hypothetical protein
MNEIASLANIMGQDVIDRRELPPLINAAENKKILIKVKSCVTSKYFHIKPNVKTVEHIVMPIPYTVKRILELKNVFIAGSYALSRLLETEYNDIDIFLYGLTPREADFKINQIINVINSNRGENNIVTYYKNERCLTIVDFYYTKFQIIFRLYKSQSEILHGFDIGASQFGMSDPNTIKTTNLGAFFLKTHIIIFDHTRRSLNYEYRIRKYINRGFGVIFPDMENVNYAKLPGFCELYKCNTKGATFHSCGWDSNACKQCSNCNTENDHMSDYILENLGDSNQLRFSNLKCIIDNNMEYISIKGGKMDIFINTCDIDIHPMLENYAKKYSKEVDKLRKLFNEDQTRNIILTNFDMDVKLQETTIKNIIDEMVPILQDRLDKFNVKKSVPINYIIKNPGSQLCGSFNPVYADAKSWYGEYYKWLPRYTHEMDLLLRLARRFSKESLLYLLSKDVLFMIINRIVRG